MGAQQHGNGKAAVMQFRQEVLNVVGGVVALGLVAILAFITWALVFRAIPVGNENTLIQLVGVLSANIGLVVGFFFGASSQQKKQAETIDKLAETTKAAQAAALPADPAIPLSPGESVKVTADGTQGS